MSADSNIRQSAKEAIEALPDNSTWEDVFYTLYVRKKIEAGLADAEAGNLLSSEDVKKLLEERE